MFNQKCIVCKILIKYIIGKPKYTKIKQSIQCESNDLLIEMTNN